MQGGNEGKEGRKEGRKEGPCVQSTLIIGYLRSFHLH